MSAKRRAGILLHPTSLPSPYGMGDIGPAARAFVDWLASARMQIWQTLPLTPPDGAGSPYASPSAFARSPWLISLDDLVEDGWLLPEERPWGIGRPDRVDHEAVMAAKRPVLMAAAARIAAAVDLRSWADAHPWVHDWAAYEALAAQHGGDWSTWPTKLRDRDPTALAAALQPHAEAMAHHTALQWVFDVQWQRLRTYATHHGVCLWGDVPIFVGAGSVDVWVHRHLFRLDAAGKPTVVSGVPPDAFSPDGQVWGTPLFDHAAHAADGWQWWCDRVAHELSFVHELRLDHFRGIAGMWEVPVGEAATAGQWIDGPGDGLLAALKARIGRDDGSLPMIAEDLGIITPDVTALRDAYSLRGMAVLQFAFRSRLDDGRHAYLPHNHVAHSVVYTGTHDNDTAVGWYHSADQPTQDHLRRYLSTDAGDVAWDLLRCAWRSVAKDAIVPLQDVLSLGGDARMNVPGLATGNWSWRLHGHALSVHSAARLAEETRLGGRLPLVKD